MNNIIDKISKFFNIFKKKDKIDYCSLVIDDVRKILKDKEGKKYNILCISEFYGVSQCDDPYIVDVFTDDMKYFERKLKSKGTLMSCKSALSGLIYIFELPAGKNTTVKIGIDDLTPRTDRRLNTYLYRE